MKDSLCAYYTNSHDITSYMVSSLQIESGNLVLEPAAGEGIFIDEIISNAYNVHVDALDIDDKAISILEKKYSNNTSISVRRTDTLFDWQLDKYDSMNLFLKQTNTLLDDQLDFFSVLGGHYDRIIGNPPYGAWQDYEKRHMLKKKYPGQYVKETYSLFLLRCISVLKIHGSLSFIIPDTYLFLNMHSKLREILLTNTKIKEILIFPSRFFPGVSFGYSNLSIITLERCDTNEAINNIVRIIKGFRSSTEFATLLENTGSLDHLEIFNLKQSDILKAPKSRFILTKNDNIEILNSAVNLGDVADVVTGFYTGDNKRFIRVLNENVKGSKGYKTIEDSKIFICTSNDGIDIPFPGFIPYIKSSSKRKYLRGDDEWFVQWDKNTVQFYLNDKKARFQNPLFYFKTGIGIPMVKSGSLHAFLMEGRVFDQSIVGIFPKDNNNLYYLLALMNSDTINELIHIINPTANNSANYVKQLPFIEPSKDMKNEINSMVKKVLDLLTEEKESEAMLIHDAINATIKKIYSRVS